MQYAHVKTNENSIKPDSYSEPDASSAAPDMMTKGAQEVVPDEKPRSGLFDQLDPEEMRLHVTILGWLSIIGNGVLLLIGGFVFTFLSGIGAVSQDPQALAVLSMVGTTVGILLGALALPGMIAGFGLLRGREWGRILGLVTAIIGLLNFPLGTLIGVYALWVLLQKESAVYFGKKILR